MHQGKPILPFQIPSLPVLKTALQLDCSYLLGLCPLFPGPSPCPPIKTSFCPLSFQSRLNSHHCLLGRSINSNKLAYNSQLYQKTFTKTGWEFDRSFVFYWPYSPSRILRCKHQVFPLSLQESIMKLGRAEAFLSSSNPALFLALDMPVFPVPPPNCFLAQIVNDCSQNCLSL